MPRNLYLWNDGHMSEPCIFNNLLDVLLSVESALWLPVRVLPVIVRRERPFRSHFGEPRVLFYLNSPTLILRQMPMEHVQFPHRHQVYELLHEFLRIIVPSAVQHHASVGERRSVADLAAWRAPSDAEDFIL